MREFVSKPFPKHLLEKSGLHRYTQDIGTTVITIVFDADTQEGLLTAIWSDPKQKGQPDSK